jgi:hypothetical protein
MIDLIRQPTESARREAIVDCIAVELCRAYKKHGRAPWSRHEFYGVILEEFEEMWDDIKADAPDEKLDKEIIQVAAMCIRFLETRTP